MKLHCFAGDFQNVSSLCDKRGLKLTVLDSTEGTAGGYKKSSAALRVKVLTRYSNSNWCILCNVPDTGTNGRVHTSVASVAVLPEVEDVNTRLNPADIEVQTARSEGAGSGRTYQWKQSSAWHINDRYCDHVSGLNVHSMETGAMKMLIAKLYEMETEKQNAEISSARKSMVKQAIARRKSAHTIIRKAG